MTDPVRPVAPRYETDDATWLEDLAGCIMREGVEFYAWTPMRLRAVAQKLRLAAAPVPCAASPADRRNEWRLDEHGILDDVVVDDVETFRMERMSDDHVWGAIYHRDGSRTDFDVFGERLSWTHEPEPRATGAEAHHPADAVLQHLWTLAAQFEPAICNAIRDPIDAYTRAQAVSGEGVRDEQHDVQDLQGTRGADRGTGELQPRGLLQAVGNQGDSGQGPVESVLAERPVVAVSLDPHRLLTLEWFIERLRDRGNNWQQDADNWRHGRGQRTREKRGYEVLDACGGSLLELADGFVEELARLRGEATVRVEE